MTSQPTEARAPTVAARASLLRAARAWQAAGQINSATDAYGRLLTRYPGTPEAGEATAEMLGIAQAYERQGQYRLALALYDRLERLS